MRRNTKTYGARIRNTRSKHIQYGFIVTRTDLYDTVCPINFGNTTADNGESLRRTNMV